MTEIAVQRAVEHAVCPPDEDFRAWVEAALTRQAGEASLAIRVVGSDESRRLNHQYRGQDKATNVLSFDSGCDEGLRDLLREQGEPVPLGDLVICAPVVALEAAEQGKPERSHWAHLVVHGVLHLQGYDHLEEAEAERMEGLEREILQGLGIADPYAAR